MLSAGDFCLVARQNGAPLAETVTGEVARKYNQPVHTDNRKLQYRMMFGYRFYARLTEGIQKSADWDRARAAPEGAPVAEGDRAEPRHCIQVVSYRHFVLLALRKAELKRINNASSPPYDMMFVKSARSYAVMHTPADMLRLYRQIPPADRCVEEVLLTDTPHRFFMDIERELSPEEQSADADVIADMLQFCERNFIPELARFFCTELGVPCAAEDWLLTNASKARSKFSVHMVLATAGRHYFGNRVESWLAAALLAAHLEAVADASEDFNRWYRPPGGKRVVDFSVYARGARNMRLLGACKPGDGGARVGEAHWRSLRPFLPRGEQRFRPWTDFVATVNQAPYEPGWTRVALRSPHFFERVRAFLTGGQPCCAAAPGKAVLARAPLLTRAPFWVPARWH
jgi:hypothetical protein